MQNTLLAIRNMVHINMYYVIKRSQKSVESDIRTREEQKRGGGGQLYRAAASSNVPVYRYAASVPHRLATPLAL